MPLAAYHFAMVSDRHRNGHKICLDRDARLINGKLIIPVANGDKYFIGIFRSSGCGPAEEVCGTGLLRMKTNPQSTEKMSVAAC